MKTAPDNDKIKACLELWMRGATLTQVAVQHNMELSGLSKQLSRYDGRRVITLKKIRWQNMVDNIVNQLLPKVMATGFRPKWEEVFNLCGKSRPLANAVYKEFKRAELVRTPCNFTTCTPENTAKAVRLIFAGKTRNQVAHEMNLTRYQVDLILRRYAREHPGEITKYFQAKWKKERFDRSLKLTQQLGRLPKGRELRKVAQPKYHKEILALLKKRGYKAAGR